ncbi:unnamed protein product, partial [Citrullus colocynthis]
HLPNPTQSENSKEEFVALSIESLFSGKCEKEKVYKVSLASSGDENVAQRTNCRSAAVPDTRRDKLMAVTSMNKEDARSESHEAGDK